MDERGRPNTIEEVEALIAQAPNGDDPCELALQISNDALDTDSPFDGRLYLLWACFTDWVELNEDAEVEAFGAMRAPALEWPSVNHDEQTAAA